MYPCKSHPKDHELPRAFPIFCDNAMRSYGFILENKGKQVFANEKGRYRHQPPCEVRTTLALVGALALDVTGLLALVAHLFATGGLLRAVARKVASLATVVALGALDAVP
jgi:hypothetical protein